MQGRLSGALEDNILTLLCFSDQFAAAVSLEVPAELFSTRAYQRIAEKATDYLARFRAPPKKHIRDLLEEDLRRGDEGKFLNQIIEAMEELSTAIQPDYVLSELKDFVASRTLSNAITIAADALHAGDLAGAQEALRYTNSHNAIEPGTWFHDTDKWLSFLNKNDEDFISSGIDVLDEHGIHPKLKELFLIIAAAKRGKSWHLMQIGKRAVIEQHKKVLHITLENSAEITQQRYTQSILAMSTSDIRSMRVSLFNKSQGGKFTLDFSQISPDNIHTIGRAEVARQLVPWQARGKLLVQWFPTGSLTLAQLDAYLDSLEKVDGFIPNLLLLDYADLMYTDERNLRVSTGRLFRDLRGLAGRRNLALVTATQGNRASNDARTVTSTMVGEDWSKIGTADTVITYSQTSAEKELNLARILVAAARTGMDGWIAQITQSYATGQFCLDSVYMSKFVADEIARHTEGEHANEEA